MLCRYGFNSSGHDSVKLNIERQTLSDKVIVGVNLGKNKWTQNANEDYVKGILKFCDLPSVHYFVINISSPNTPNLRDLQNKNELKDLIAKVVEIKQRMKICKPFLIKIAPDLNDTQLKDIADVINMSSKTNRGIDGLIISNTTIDRPQTLLSNQQLIQESGGLSGAPLKSHSTEVIRKMYKLTNGKIPIVGVGGIFSGEDAYQKLKAGASLVQIYTSLTYEA